MTWTLGQIVDRSVFEGIDEAEAIQITNQRYAEMVRRSGYLRQSLVLGTASGPPQTTFTLPPNVGRIRYVYVAFIPSGAIVRYPNKIGAGDLLAVMAGDLVVQQNSYAEMAELPGTGLVLGLTPAPDAGGYVTAICEMYPTALVDDSDQLVIPDEFVQGLLDGIRSVVLRELDEDMGSSQAMEQSFNTAVEQLKDFTRAQAMGDGPIALPMRGVHW